MRNALSGFFVAAVLLAMVAGGSLLAVGSIENVATLFLNDTTTTPVETETATQSPTTTPAAVATETAEPTKTSMPTETQTVTPEPTEEATVTVVDPSAYVLERETFNPSRNALVNDILEGVPEKDSQETWEVVTKFGKLYVRKPEQVDNTLLVTFIFESNKGPVVKTSFVISPGVYFNINIPDATNSHQTRYRMVLLFTYSPLDHDFVSPRVIPNRIVMVDAGSEGFNVIDGLEWCATTEEDWEFSAYFSLDKIYVPREKIICPTVRQVN